MKKITTTLAAVVLALAAREAAATPVDGIARYALGDAATLLSAPAEFVSCAGPELSVDVDDLTVAQGLGTDEQRMDVATALAADPSMTATLRAPTLIARALAAIGNVFIVPFRYGCAVIGAEKDPRPMAPRMLTLF